MKKLFLLLSLSLILKSALPQSVIESEVQNIIKTQIFFSSEETVYVFVPLPFLFFYGSYTYLDNGIYFKTDDRKSGQSMNYKEIATTELLSNLPLKFTGSAYPQDFKINTFLGDNLPVSIDVANNNQEIIIKVSSNDGTFSRESTYINDRLTDILIKNSAGTSLTHHKYSEDSIRIYNFNSFDADYRIIDKIYENDQLQKQIFYKNSKVINDLRIKNYSIYKYNSDKKLSGIITKNHKDKRIDSTSIVYIDNGFVEYHYGKEGNFQKTSLFDTNNNIISKRITNATKRFNINYLYDNNNRLSIIDVNDETTNEKIRYSFTYLGGKFIELQKFYYREGLPALNLVNKVTFKYNNEDILENVTVIDPNGSIEKALRYEMNK